MIPIVVAYGDGIGPEIMDAVLYIIRKANVPISVQSIEIGKRKYEMGHPSGIPDEAWNKIAYSKILLKAPITTPQGGGYRSLNVTLRKRLGLYANVRPCISYSPMIESDCKNMDMVIIRENEEDIYSGVEYRTSANMYTSLKMISSQGSERICRYAFEYAKKYQRKKVTCMAKDNIMKYSDGIFRKTFDKVAKEYPEFETDYYIIDIGTARVAARPADFDIIVTENLYGDIISDVAAEVSGSVGMAGSANIGREFSMFEAIHGSAPDIADQDIANPSALLNGVIQMLVHIGMNDKAWLIQNAWLATLEQGIHTADIFTEGKSHQKVGTKDFANAVVDNMGNKPQNFPSVKYESNTGVDYVKKIDDSLCYHTRDTNKLLLGVDISIDSTGYEMNQLSTLINKISLDNEITCIAIIAKGIVIYPVTSVMQENISIPDTITLRFCKKDLTKSDNEVKLTSIDVLEIMSAIYNLDIDIVKMDSLYSFDDQAGFFANELN